MKYYSLSNSTVKITLSEEDMREYSLCPENITRHTTETKRIFVQMLKKLRIFPDYSTERLFLEAFPKAEGGCVLYVSSLGGDSAEEYNPDFSGKIPLLCATDGLHSVISLCRGLIAMGENPEACVYRDENGYYIVVATEIKNTSKIKHFLSEYGTVSHNLSEISALREYGEPVCMENACERLSQLY